MNFSKQLLILFLAVFTISCSGGSDDPEPDVRTAQDVINDFQNLEIQPGINDLTLESLIAGVFWNFRVIAPSDASPSNLRPLVMTLHGASGGSPTAHKNTACYDEPGLAALNAFIISPNAGQGEWFDEANQQQVVALMDLAMTYWDVDTDKTLVTGYSNGGNASWFYAEFYSDFFSAAIPMASSYNPEKGDGTVPALNIPLYVIHGENDELFPLNDTIGFVEASRNAGSEIEFVVATGLSHFAPCDYVSYLQDAVAWVMENVWD